MDVLLKARELYVAGEFYDALQAAQVAAEKAPRSPEAWRLLGLVSRHAGMPNASDDAFRRAAQLSRRHRLPVRLSPGAFAALVASVTESLSPDARRRLAGIEVKVAALPGASEVREGVDPDLASLRTRAPRNQLTLFQVNLENRCASEAELRGLIERTLSRG